MESPAFELLAEEGERGLHLLVPSVPERFQCQRGAARRAVARVEVVFLGVVAGKRGGKNAHPPAQPPHKAKSMFFFVLERTKPPKFVVCRETPPKTPLFVQTKRRGIRG